jgi:hypothetical protein
MDDLKEPVVAFGLNQDPVREKYNGVTVASFLKKMQAAAVLPGFPLEVSRGVLY